jgi:hypothetical protein
VEKLGASTPIIAASPASGEAASAFRQYLGKIRPFLAANEFGGGNDVTPMATSQAANIEQNVRQELWPMNRES